MRAGLMRERLGLQSKTETVSNAGVVSSTWATWATVWGRVKQEDGRSAEQGIGDRPMAQTKVTMIIRYNASVTTGMRVAWRGRYFEIEGVINRDERRRSLDLMMIERVSP